MTKDEDAPTKVLVDKDEYEELIDTEKFLNALFAAGVDNWEGYGVAQDMMD